MLLLDITWKVGGGINVIWKWSPCIYSSKKTCTILVYLLSRLHYSVLPWAAAITYVSAAVHLFCDVWNLSLGLISPSQKLKRGPTEKIWLKSGELKYWKLQQLNFLWTFDMSYDRLNKTLAKHSSLSSANVQRNLTLNAVYEVHQQQFPVV